MLNHLLALLGLVGLCAGWMVFQLWLGKQDADRKDGYRPGCGACSSKKCSRDSRLDD